MKEPFTPHPYFSDEVNNNISESELLGGCYFEQVTPGQTVQVLTQNNLYLITKVEGNKALIKGHRVYCPEWTECVIHGSTWGGSMLKVGFIGRGMHLEFSTRLSRTITTSKIQEVSIVS